MGGVDVMEESQELVDCYFSPLLHHHMDQERVIFINILCVMMCDSPFLAAQEVPYSRMAMLDQIVKRRDLDPKHHWVRASEPWFRASSVFWQ
jgi:hypothetical protein